MRRLLAGLRATPATFERLRGRRKPWLLLAWDVPGLRAAVMEFTTGEGQVTFEAFSPQADFADAVDEILAAIAVRRVKPVQVALAARQLLPAVIDLPVSPDKPKPLPQMRELARTELEQLLGEFGSLWSLGAVLSARCHLSAEDRERVILEDALRQENRHKPAGPAGRQAPARFGETAVAMGLVERTTLNQCLDIQTKLQRLETELTCGWNGRLEERQPLWLGCAVGLETHRVWREALADRGLRLAACLPLAWLAGEDAGAADGGAARLDLELHSEEVVAVLRRCGRVVASRSEARIGRPPGAEWLARLVAHWAGEPRLSLELVCLHAADEISARALSEDLFLMSGHPVTLRPHSAVWERLWNHLAREAAAPASRLPRLAERELRGPRWKHPEFFRLAALVAAVSLLALVEGEQRWRAQRLSATLAEKAHIEREKSHTSQQQTRISAELEQLGRELEKARRELGPVLADRERLAAIAAMRENLPRLLQTLARAVGSDAVLESVRNSRAGDNAATIQVVAWSPSYTGAQAFVGRVATLAAGLHYGASQAETIERHGRQGKAGHEVSFWLMPESSSAAFASSPLAGPAPTPGAPGPGGNNRPPRP